MKLVIPVEENPVKNRFEIRLKNERAFHAIIDLINHQDVGASIINRYLRFVDKDRTPLNTFEKTLNWLAHQVAPTLKLAMNIDLVNQTTVIHDMVRRAELTDKQKKMLEQQTVSIQEVILK